MDINSNTIKESSKEIPVISDVDVVVVGSGMAGSAAAIAAAKNGARVCLIEKENCPEGLATLGLVWYYLPLCDGYGSKMMGGLAEEFLKLSVKYGPDGKKYAKSATNESTINRIYYSMFYAVDSLLITMGLSSSKHAGVLLSLTEK